MRDERFVLIPAPTSSGKSYNGARTRWRETDASGGKPVVHLHYTQDSRKEAVEDSEEEGVEYRELLGREEACPTVAGDHDDTVVTPTGEPASKWLRRQCDEKGDALSHAHHYLQDEVEANEGELPCEPCQAIEQWDNVPYDDGGNVSADVVHATHMFAYVPSLVSGTNLFFDERPNFLSKIGEGDDDEFSVGRFQEIVTTWLDHINAPVDTWEEFVASAKGGQDQGIRDTIDAYQSVNSQWLVTESKAHSLAPALTEATYDALANEPDRNGRRVGYARSWGRQFDENIKNTLSSARKRRDQREALTPSYDPRSGRTRITLLIDEKNRPLAYWNVPEMGNARSIICLDAWPSIHEWRQNVGENITREEIISSEDFDRWRKFERGLEVVQIGRSTRPASSDHAVTEYVNEDQQEIVIDELIEEFGTDFSSIIYPDSLEESMNELLPDRFKRMTLGNVKSNNSFRYEPVGLVTNSIDPGDDYVLNLLAARGLDAVPETDICIHCDGGGCKKCEEGVRRIRGRQFTGPDSDEADAMLTGVRNYSIAQAVGRWARSSDSPQALVFARTSTVPDEMVDLTIDGVWEYRPAQKSIVDLLRQNPGMTAKKIATEVDVTKRYVLKVLKRLEELDMLTRINESGLNGADEFLLKDEASTDGVLDLSRV
jgi:hypothetical protein